MDQMVTAVEIAARHGISDKRLRGALRAQWPWPRRKHDFWAFPVESQQAAKMNDVARGLANA